MNSVVVQRATLEHETCQQIHSYTKATVITRILFMGTDNVGRLTVLYLYAFAANNRRRKALCFMSSPADRPLSINVYYTWRDISVLSGRILTKLGTNIHHVSGHCWKDFQDQRSMSNRTVKSRREWPETASDDRTLGVKWITKVKPINLLISSGDMIQRRIGIHFHATDAVASRFTCVYNVIYI